MLKELVGLLEERDALEEVRSFIQNKPTKLNEVVEWEHEWHRHGGEREWWRRRGTLLHYSCLWNRPKVVSYLLSQNADVTKCFRHWHGGDGWDEDGRYDGLTAQQIAEKCGYVDIVNLIEPSKREQAAREAERERVAREAAERERVAREAAERERVAREQAAREQAAREAAEKEKVITDWFCCISLGAIEREKYSKLFIHLGFDDLTAISLIEEKEMEVNFSSIPVGHRKKIWQQIQILKKLPGNTTSTTTNIHHQGNVEALLKPAPQQKSTLTVPPSPNPQHNAEKAVTELNPRCFDNVESNARVPLAPFILLNSSESPVPFEDAILCAYEGVSISDYLDSFMAHGEGEIFEYLAKKGTTITLPECLAVYFYTLEWPQKDLNTYTRLNKCLVSENREGARPWRFFLHYLFGALRKIPKWNGQQDLYRGVSCNLVQDYPDKYILGTKISWYSCTSTTTNLPKIMAFLPPNKPRTIFTINGVFSGRLIQNFSAVPDEAEILIPPGSRFEIVGVVQLDTNTTMIQMKQVASLEKQLKME